LPPSADDVHVVLHLDRAARLEHDPAGHWVLVTTRCEGAHLELSVWTIFHGIPCPNR
jgi:hypothetical protein